MFIHIDPYYYRLATTKAYTDAYNQIYIAKSQIERIPRACESTENCLASMTKNGRVTYWGLHHNRVDMAPFICLMQIINAYSHETPFVDVDTALFYEGPFVDLAGT